MERPTIPENEILAACYAFLEPTNNLWDHYLAEVDRLKTAGQISVQHHYLLRNSTVAKQALVDATLGDEDAFESDTVHRVLERVVTSITGELAESHRLEILEKDRERDLVEQSSHLRISELVATKESVESLALEMARRNEQQDRELAVMRRRMAAEQVKVITTVVGILLFAASVVALVLGIAGPTAFLAKLAFWAASIVLAVTATLGMFTGWSFGGWRAALIERRVRRLEGEQWDNPRLAEPEPTALSENDDEHQVDDSRQRAG